MKPSPIEEVTSPDQHSAIRALLPQVYDELRMLAAAQLAGEQPGQSLQATALVHEVFLKLTANQEHAAKFADRRYFFAAAAQAMQRILIDAARRRNTQKHGGAWQRVDLGDFDPAESGEQELTQLSEALEALAQVEPVVAELVNLRWFAGRSMPEVAELLGISLRTAERHWTYARAWLFERLQKLASVEP